MFKHKQVTQAGLLGLVLILLALAAWGPHLPQPAHIHAFADRHPLGLLPHALNVLSNLPFAYVLPWEVAQFGRMLAVLWLALGSPRRQALDIRWLGVLLAYGIAKVFELEDQAVYDLTGLVSGHTLKHVAAALAAWPVIAALGRATHTVQNAAGLEPAAV